MKDVTGKNLLSVMDRMRSMVAPETEPPACREVNWNEPHHYAVEQTERLTDISAKMAAPVQKTLQYYCDEAFVARAVGFAEHFACNLAAEVKMSRRNRFYLTLLSPDKSQAGYVELSFESAACLVAQMLRDPEAEIGKDGEMSTLEQSILLDIVQAITDALTDELALYQIKLVRAEQLTYGEWPMRFRELQEMTRFEFAAECGQAKLDASVCLLDAVLDPALGLEPVVHSPEDIKKYPERVVARMQDASMQVTAQLSSAMMTLNDILTLEAGDVIVLGQKPDCPIGVLINGQTCFKAWPARHAGRLALQVMAAANE